MATRTLGDLEAERAILGAVLLDNDCLEAVSRHLRAEDFSARSHRRVYEAIQALSGAGAGMDIVTVTDQMTRSGTLEEAGGPAAVSDLTSVVPTTANVEFYAQKVKGLSQRRALFRLGQQLQERARDAEASEDELVDQAEQDLFAIADQRPVAPYTRAYDLMPDTVSHLEKLFKLEGQLPGIPSGYADLDRMTGGFQDDDLVIIGARPSLGKSSIALSMAANMTIREHVSVGIFSLETGRRQLMQRLIAGEGRIDSANLRRGTFRQSDFDRILDVGGKLAAANLFLNDTANIRLVDLRAQARRMRAREGVQILFVDYISLIVHDRQNIPRYEQMADVSRSLKALARELGIPIIAVSQLRRETEGRRPNLADLRETGSLEQDADIVILLHRDRDKEDEQLVTEVILAKNRNGPIGTVELAFVPRFTRFESIVRERQGAA